MNPLQAGYAAAVTPHNSTDITGATSEGFFIYVGVAGDVSVATTGGQSPVIFKNVPAGSIVGNGLKVNRVNSTNTTATNMVAIR